MRRLIPLLLLLPSSAFAGISIIETGRQADESTGASIMLYLQGLFEQLVTLVS